MRAGPGGAAQPAALQPADQLTGGDRLDPGVDEDLLVEMEEEPSERKVTDDKGNVIEIEYADGSIAISLDGKPIEDGASKRDDSDWFRNLVDDIDDTTLYSIADSLITGTRISGF